MDIDLVSGGKEPSEAGLNVFGLRLPWKATSASVIVTLLVTVDFYFDILNRVVGEVPLALSLRYIAWDRLGLYLLIPLAVIVLIFRDRPTDYGFSLGDWRAGVKWTLLIWAVATPILYGAAQTAGMQAYYARYMLPAKDLVVTTAIDLFGWEFVFRGFLLFALYRVAGPSAVVLQAVPFALAHLTKPPLETLSTIFGGFVFGWVAWRTRSFLYPYLIHLYVTLCVMFFVSMAQR